MALAMLKKPILPEHGWLVLVRAVEQFAAAADLAAIIEIVRNTARDISGADGVCFVLRDGDECHYVEEHAIGPLWTTNARLPKGASNSPNRANCPRPNTIRGTLKRSNLVITLSSKPKPRDRNHRAFARHRHRALLLRITIE